LQSGHNTETTDMSLVGIAAKAGTTSANIAKLISSGQGSPAIAARLGTTSASITDFINGKASPGIAQRLGTTTMNAQLLRNVIGREGAIGLILGLACGLHDST
jgi:hypothetical protein